MPKLHIAKVALIVRAKLPREVLQQHLPAPIESLGDQLANQANQYATEHQLGYFPALEFFQGQGGVDEFLLDAAEQISTFSLVVTRQEVMRVLQPIFSSVRITDLQSLAYTMPTVRPNQPHALKRLAEHYVADKVKFEVIVTLIQRQEPPPGIEKSAKQMAARWLSEVFEELEVTSARLLDS
ncbi:hypothetical protein [Kaarinaea lacus]